MGSFKNIRQSIDRKLDRLEARADTLAAHMDATRDDASTRVEAQKQKMRDALDRFDAQVDKAKDLSDEKKAEVHTGLDHLKLQLALGKMEAGDAADEQARKIRQAWTDLSATIDRDIETFDDKLESLGQDLVAESDKLDAELDGMKLQFAKERDEVRERLTASKTELNARIGDFKAQIAEKRGQTKDKAVAYETELTRKAGEMWEGLLDRF